MGSFAWDVPDRHELYLAARVLSGDDFDGDWVQWASNVVLIDLELYDDPEQGKGFWLHDDELSVANAFAEALWSVLKPDPLNAPDLLAASPLAGTVRQAASALLVAIERNGRGVPQRLVDKLACAAAEKRSQNSVRAWWDNVAPLLFGRR